MSSKRPTSKSNVRGKSAIIKRGAPFSRGVAKLQMAPPNDPFSPSGSWSPHPASVGKCRGRGPEQSDAAGGGWGRGGPRAQRGQPGRGAGWRERRAGCTLPEGRFHPSSCRWTLRSLPPGEPRGKILPAS